MHWLNVWAEKSGRTVRFDGINAGREGIPSTDIAAIVRQEVRPAEPDLVVYYEGANQFLYVDTPRTPGTNVPLPTPGDLRRRWMQVVAASANRSALVRRVDRLVSSFAMHGGGEPPKPSYTLPWPADLDEHAPDPTRPDLPLDLPVILQDLDSIRAGLADDGATFVLTSFVWLVWDGMQLEPRRDGLIWSDLNERTWPYRYADIRRAADLQNRVFAWWADAHDVPFIDIAAAMPADPSLFYDAIHLNSEGMRVQAWLVTQGLLPIITAQLNAGVWPRPDRVPTPVHPGIGATYPFVLRCPAAQRP